MKMWKEVLLIVSIVGYCLGATLEPCPEGPLCHSAAQKLETKSFEFLGKLSQKDFRSIGSLTITNASINKMDPKLKYLKNLAYLDLSYNSVQISSIPPLNSLRTLILKANDLKDINISRLPQNIEYLDLSDNLLSQIPREWRLLKNLKTLDLYKNPIDCDCNNVLNYEQLNKSGINIPKSLTCHSPSRYAGKEVSAINCSPADIMQYDEPAEGSGDPDIFGDSIAEKVEKIPIVNEYNDDEIDATALNTIIDDKDEFAAAKITTLDPLETVTEEEGSGDEGSGFEINPVVAELGCLENCNSPTPLEKDSTASPLPDIIDQLKIIIDDVNIFKKSETTTTTTTTKTTTTTEAPVSPAVVPVKEPKILKGETSKNQAGLDKLSEVEQLNNVNATNTGELERASINPKNSTAVYAIVGVGLFIAILFIIAFVKKRKSKRMKNNRRENPVSLGEEMKPLSKSQITSVNEKPTRNSSNLPEHVPLINGQNGKPRDDTPQLKSFTPLAHPELPNKLEDDENPLQNGSTHLEGEEVEIRSKAQPELLTPQRERVTIRESEIPESVPRTPLLVHRQKNSDGEIVTTLVS